MPPPWASAQRTGEMASARGSAPVHQYSNFNTTATPYQSGPQQPQSQQQPSYVPGYVQGLSEGPRRVTIEQQQPHSQQQSYGHQQAYGQQQSYGQQQAFSQQQQPFGGYTQSHQPSQQQTTYQPPQQESMGSTHQQSMGYTQQPTYQSQQPAYQSQQPTYQPQPPSNPPPQQAPQMYQDYPQTMPLHTPASPIRRSRQTSGSRVPMLKLAGAPIFGGLPQGQSWGPGYAHKDAHRKWTMDQLRQTDGIIPLQSGTNQFASQRGMTGFGTPRNTKTKVEADPTLRPNLDELPPLDNDQRIGRFSVGQLRASDGIIPSQYGTNQFASQRGMTSFGSPRDVGGKHLHRFWDGYDDYGGFDDYGYAY